MPRPRKFYKPQQPKTKKNEQIRVPEVRVVDNEGNNLDVMQTQKAIELAKEKGLDLILISEKANPPVARIMDWGKYIYRQEKRDKGAKKKQSVAGEMKGIRIGMQTGEHDLLIKAKKVDKFLKKGYKVRVELIMRGREKALRHMADKKLEEFLAALTEEHKIEQEPKKSPRGGINVTIAKK